MSTLDSQFPFGQRIGLFILAEVSAISASSVVILLGYIAVRCEPGRVDNVSSHGSSLV